METMNLELLKSMGIEYKIEFVPFSRSRNKDNKDKSLNWTVTIKRNNIELTTDYMQGCGHVPIPKNLEKRCKQRAIEYACEKGVKPSYIIGIDKICGIKPISKPTLKEVLWSLLMDRDVMDFPSFEEWALEYGYDTDSRSGEKIYNACLAIGLKINLMFNESELESLTEFYQDY